MKSKQNQKYETAFKEAVAAVLTSDNPDGLAMEAGLTPNQWKCIQEYLEVPNISIIAEVTGIGRANVYAYLSAGFTKLQSHIRKG